MNTRATRWSLRFLSLTALLSIAGPAPAQARSGKHWEVTVVHTETMAAGTQALQVTAGAGNIEILQGTGSELSIEARVRAKKRALKQHQVSDQFEDHVELVSSGNTLSITDRHTGEDGWQVSFKVLLPRALAIEATSGAGNVTIEHAAEKVQLTTGAGNIRLNQPKDSLNQIVATSGAGNVDLRLAAVSGQVKATSGVGNVKLTLLASGAGDRVDLTTGTGNVALVVPRTIDGTFDISTGIGSVKVDRHLGLKVKRTFIGATASGSVGNGAPPYRLSTGTGSINVKVRKS